MTEKPNDTSENTPAEVPKTPPAVESGKSAPPAADWDGSVDSLPPRVQEMLRELRQENADYRRGKKAAEDAAEKAEKQRLAEQGEYRKLYEKVSGEVEPLRSRADRAAALEAFVTETVKAQIEALPAQFKGLVPEYDDPLKTLGWLQANAKTLVPPKAPNLDPGQRGTGGAPTLNGEQAAIAKRFGISAEEFEKAKQSK